MNHWPLIRPSGDRAVLIEFENRIDPEINRQVRSLALTIEEEKTAGIEEVLPAFRTLMVTYDPLILDHEILQKNVRSWLDKAKNIHLPPGRVFALPTVYGGEHGPDLELVSGMTGLPAAEVVRIVSETKFLVYFVGFICGLVHLGGLSEKLGVPRLNTPRAFVPAGSVGMGGGQVTVLPTDLPSGFNYIGRTFVSLYDPKGFPPISFLAGDEIQFKSVTEEEALKARGKEAAEFA